MTKPTEPQVNPHKFVRDPDKMYCFEPDCKGNPGCCGMPIKTEREIVAALAGELVSVCFEVSTGNSGATVRLCGLTSLLVCTVYQVGACPDSYFVALPSDGAAEQLRDLIKRVGELGEVSA